MREVILSRSKDKSDARLEAVFDFLEKNRKSKRNVFERPVSGFAKEVIFQTTSKELFLGLGRMDPYHLTAYTDILLHVCDPDEQVIVRFEGDTDKDRPLLVTKLESGELIILKLELA